MRTHTEEYKQALIGVRETNSVLQYFKNNAWVTLSNDDLILAKPILNANLFKTVMKELDFEAKIKIDKGTRINFRNGLKVNDDYEYMYYGNYYVYDVEYRPDTKSYHHICYDKMLDAMVQYEPLNITYPISVKNYILAIAGQCGLLGHTPIIYTGNFPNQDKLITQDYFAEGNYTYRDILDYLCEVVGGWLYIDNNNDLKLKYPEETHEVFNEDYLNYINISFDKKYGPVNSVVFARANELDNIEYKDDESIAQNGLCRVKFSDNPLLSDENRSEFLNQVAQKIIGLEFYLNDLESKGITYLELGDLYTFKISEEYVEALKTGLVKSGMRKAQGTNKTKYKCLLINNEIEFAKGINERIFTDEPEEDNSEYITTAPSDNALKNAEILVNKNAGEIVLKANSDGQVVQARLDANADNGSLFEVKADNIKLEGYTTINDGFSVDLQGNVTLTGGEIKSSNYVAETSGTKINLSNGSIDTKNFKVNSSGDTTCKNLTINGGKIKVSGYTEQSPYLLVGEDSGTEPKGTIAWDNGLSVYDYRVNTGTPKALIRTEYSGGYAQLENSTCSAYHFENLSLAEKKQDFEPLKSGLEILKNIDIYKYRYKGEKGKKKIGFVIGENYKYSKEITSKENDSVDLYSFVSVCCKAIQEQQEQINYLKEEIKKIKESDK